MFFKWLEIVVEVTPNSEASSQTTVCKLALTKLVRC